MDGSVARVVDWWRPMMVGAEQGHRLHRFSRRRGGACCARHTYDARSRRPLSLVLGCALVWALAGRAIPALAAGDTSRVPRLHSPVGYWNGLALLADGALVLGAWLAVAASRRLAVRAVGAALVYVAVLAGLSTSSRAGVLGGLLGLGLWLWLGPRRVESASTVVVAGLPAAVVAGWAFTQPALVDTGQSHAARVHSGAIFGALAVVGLVVAVGGTRALVPRLVIGRERLVARTLVAGAVAAISSGSPSSPSSQGIRSRKRRTAFRRPSARTRGIGSAARTTTGSSGGARRRRCPGTGPSAVLAQGHSRSRASVTGRNGGRSRSLIRCRCRCSPGRASSADLPPRRLRSVALLPGEAYAARSRRNRASCRRRGGGVACRVLASRARRLRRRLPCTHRSYAAARRHVTRAGPTARARPSRDRRSSAVIEVAATAIVSFALPWLAVQARHLVVRGGETPTGSNRLRTRRGARGRWRTRCRPSRSTRSRRPSEKCAATRQALGAAYTHARRRCSPRMPTPWSRLGLFESSCRTPRPLRRLQALNHSYTLDPRNTR